MIAFTRSGPVRRFDRRRGLDKKRADNRWTSSTGSSGCLPTCSPSSTISRRKRGRVARTSSTSAWAIPTCRRRSTSSTNSSRPPRIRETTATRRRAGSRASVARSRSGIATATPSTSIPIRRRSPRSVRRKVWRTWHSRSCSRATACSCPTPPIRSTRTRS